MNFYQWIEAVCISSSSESSTFTTAHGNETVCNKTIRPGAIPKEALEPYGGVKVGTHVKLFKITFPNNKAVTYINDSKLEQKKPSYTSYGIENEAHENKSSLKHAAKEDIVSLMDNVPSQYRVIANELSAFANARMTDYELTIGTDSDGNPSGIQSEVSNVVDAESQLRNYLSQTLSASYTAGLRFVWEEPDTARGKVLVLRIQGKRYSGGPLLVGGTYCYLRSGSNCQRLFGTDLINFIRNY